MTLPDLERACLAHGVSVFEFRAFTFREALQVLRARTEAAQERNEALRVHAAKIQATIINYAGMAIPDDPVTPQDILDASGDTETPSMSRERYEANVKRHHEQLKRTMAQKQREADPTYGNDR